MRNFTRLCVVPIFFGTLLLVSGCAEGIPGVPSSVTQHVVHEDDLGLEDALLAAYVTPQNVELNYGAPGGYLLLVNSAGQVRLFRTSGMDEGQLDWDRYGLFFSDDKYDYRLSDKLVKARSPKTNAQLVMHSTGDGGSVAVYNDGFTESGYVNQLVVFNGTSSTLHEVEGNYFTSGLCENGLYGISDPTGPYAKQAEDLGYQLMGEYSQTAYVFAKLWKTSALQEEVLKIRPMTESSSFGNDNPCLENTLYSIDNRYENDGDDAQDIPIVRQWNTQTGDMTEVDMTIKDSDFGDTSSGKDLGFVPKLSGESLRDGNLEWVAQNSTVMSTNPNSGATTKLFDLAEKFDARADDYSIVFTEQELFTVVWHQQEGSAYLASYDRATGKVTRRIDLPVLNDLLGSGLNVLRGIAVSPTADAGSDVFVH